MWSIACFVLQYTRTHTYAHIHAGHAVNICCRVDGVVDCLFCFTSVLYYNTHTHKHTCTYTPDMRLIFAAELMTWSLVSYNTHTFNTSTHTHKHACTQIHIHAKNEVNFCCWVDFPVECLFCFTTLTRTHTHTRTHACVHTQMHTCSHKCAAQQQNGKQSKRRTNTDKDRCHPRHSHSHTNTHTHTLYTPAWRSSMSWTPRWDEVPP